MDFITIYIKFYYIYANIKFLHRLTILLLHYIILPIIENTQPIIKHCGLLFLFYFILKIH